MQQTWSVLHIVGPNHLGVVVSSLVSGRDQAAAVGAALVRPRGKAGRLSCPTINGTVQKGSALEKKGKKKGFSSPMHCLSLCIDGGAVLQGKASFLVPRTAPFFFFSKTARAAKAGGAGAAVTDNNRWKMKVRAVAVTAAARQVGSARKRCFLCLKQRLFRSLKRRRRGSPLSTDRCRPKRSGGGAPSSKTASWCAPPPTTWTILEHHRPNPLGL